MWGGGVLLPIRRHLGRGCAVRPPTKFFSILKLKMESFGAFWAFLFTVQLLVLHAKNGAFGFPRLAVACTACRDRERRNILVP